MPTVTNDGLSLYYETAGDPDAEPVVFLQGWGVGRWLWRWQRRALADQFRVILPDNRGTGQSETPGGPGNVPELFVERTGRLWSNWLSMFWSPMLVDPWFRWLDGFDRPYTISSMAGDLEAVLADAGVERAHVVGASMGGMIGLQYAIEYDRAKSLTLLGSTPGGRDAVLPDPDVQMKMASGVARAADRAELRRRTRIAMSEEFADANDDLVERILDWRADADATPRGRFLQAVAATSFDANGRLSEVEIPTQVLHGTADRVLPVENGRLLADRLPDASYTPIEGGSHLFFIEEPDRVNDHLRGFLREHRAEA
ncbi:MULTISPECIES: alpha/beta fold hydrolase [Halorussus]|uniref:alpha/beta fold hydrolase n=1 Tax=Halorussus TaxID=1070314 RepID=UPI0020A0D80F|nr:alpha/beta hydrolase [Halorussus vallis]USZ75309.1 alpha/beta hydrolase [Halorussus vallis]